MIRLYPIGFLLLSGLVARADLIAQWNFNSNPPDTTFATFSADLSTVPAANNNPLFGLRLVTAHAPGVGAYVATDAGSSYGTTGTIRLDMLTVSGNVVPEPTSAALLVLGALARARARRAQ